MAGLNLAVKAGEQATNRPDSDQISSLLFNHKNFLSNRQKIYNFNCASGCYRGAVDTWLKEGAFPHPLCANSTKQDQQL